MSPVRKLSLALTMVSAAGLILSHPATAQTPAVAPSGASYDTIGQNGNFSIGFNFTVGAQDLTVTAFGYLDDGFGSAHRIGIFDAANNLVGNEFAVVSANSDGVSGRTSASNPTFSFTTLTTPLTLLAGQSYTIVGGNYTGGVFLTGGTPTVDNRIASYNGSRYSAINNSDAFQPPAFTGGAGGDFGPTFALSAAPEPTALAGLAMGALSLGGLALRARRRHSA